MRNSLLLLLALLLGSCYYPQQPVTEATPAEVADSLGFAAQHHYTVEYNFILVADSLVLQEEMPMHMLINPEQSDSFILRRNDQMVVAQIEVIPEDSVDSVWVKVARDQYTQGWVHESELLDSVVPDDPISQGIHLFSSAHIIFAVCIALFALVALLLRSMRRRRYHLIHIDDIASPFPMLLCINMAFSAVLYASIQNFIPQTWAHYYYHPTLNPFGLPFILTLFLLSAWFFVLLALASADEIRRCLNAAEGVLYGLALLAWLAILYIVFSISTLYYIGYPLFIAYVVWAVWRYWHLYRAHYICGHCGARLHDRGECPRCGTIND